jgi:imidazolonepropionase-like amidohydrolase
MKRIAKAKASPYVIGIALAVFVTLHLGADAPRVYAIRGARIVTAAGTPLTGTLVVRSGLIEAVGASAIVPRDAETIEANGQMIYPGLIDMGNGKASDVTLPSPPANPKTLEEVERWKRSQILKAQVKVADFIKVDDPELTKLAAAGITTILATPPGEVITGQSALVNVIAPPDEPQIGNVTGSRRGTIVIKSPVALHVTFPDRPRGNAYPESLMGVIAFVRQSFLDAQHYQAEHAHYQRVRSGMTRPVDDESIEAMQSAVEGKLPVALEANSAREILRALNLARELKLDAIVTGAREADQVLADLKAQNAHVVYSLDYPQRPKSLAPDDDEPIRLLRARANAPRVPAEIEKASVLFAFESGALKDAKDFLKNAAKAVRAGLPPDAAVRALTINAAKIAGISDRLGSIEPGKIANFIMTDGDLFDEKTRMTRVFVDGRPIKN